jgi:hypothetical protein
LVLYRFDWASGLSMHMSVMCRTAQDAASLGQVLAFVRAARPTTDASTSPGAAVLIQGLDVQTNGSRIEVSGSVPINIADQIFREGGNLPTP